MNKDETLVKELADKLGVNITVNSNKKNAAYVILDRSGSMATNWVETIGAINTYVESLDKNTDIYFAVFDDKYDVVRDCKVKNFKKVTADEVSPRGYTALYDAGVTVMKKMLVDNAKRAVLTVVTDGIENASKIYQIKDVLSKLDDLKAKDYPVVYIGSEFKEVVSYASSTFAINAANSACVTSGKFNLEASMRATKTAAYFNSAAATQDSFDSMAYTASEKAELASTDDAKV